MSGFLEALSRGISGLGSPFRCFQQDYPPESEHPFAKDRKALRGDLAAAVRRTRQEASAGLPETGAAECSASGQKARPLSFRS